MSDGKLKSRPPASERSLAEFLGAAGAPTREAETMPPPREGADQGEERPAVPDTRTASQPRESTRYPWEAPGVREDVIKVFNLRLTEPYFVKLKYIAEHTPSSMQQFCMAALLPAIDAKLKELAGAEKE